MPVGAESCAEAIRIGAEIFHALRKNLAKAGQKSAVGVHLRLQYDGGLADGQTDDEGQLRVSWFF